MEPADPWKADDGGRRAQARLDGAIERRVLGEPEVRAVDVVVVEELAEQLSQVVSSRSPFDVESLIRAIQAVMTAGPARDG